MRIISIWVFQGFFQDLTLDTVIVHFVIHIVNGQSIDGSKWFP